MEIGAKVLRMNLPEVVGEKEIQVLLQWHAGQLTRYQKLMDYYKGKHEILNRPAKTDSNKANNKEVNNYAKYITEVLTGYFIGKPVTYSKEEDENNVDELLKDVLKRNDEQDENLDLCKQASIFGHAYEVLWNDSDASIKFNESSPMTTFAIMDPAAIGEKIIAAVRRVKVADLFSETSYETIEYITDKSVTKWKVEIDGNNSKYTQGEETPHSFGIVPVVEYKNNNDRIGDFEGVLSLIDSYNVFSSDCTNNIEDFVSAYLALFGMEATTPEDITKARDQGVLLFPQDGKGEYITAQLDSTSNDFNRKRLKDDIHKFSMTPDLTDENFGSTQSGVAMQFKLFTTEQVAVNKERKFKKGLQRRLELILNSLYALTGTKNDYLDIKIDFTRNIPQNNVEIVETLMKTKGTLSDETIIGLMPYDIDATDEVEKVKKDMKDNYGDYNEPNKTEEE